MNSHTEPNLADLLKQLRDDTTTLVREEIALAKTEVTEKAGALSKKAMLLGAGALLGYAALTPLLFALGFLLRDLFVSWGTGPGMANFLGLLIVALITGGISAGIIAHALGEKYSLKPDRTLRSLTKDKEMIQNKIS